MPKEQKLLSRTGLGQLSFSVGWEDVIKGISTSDKIGDQGFSPNSYNINLLSSLGEISSTSTPIEYTGFGGNYYGLVATCPNVDVGGVTGNYIRGVDSKGDFYIGKHTSWISPVGDVTNSYVGSGLSDMVSFNGRYYASSYNAFASVGHDNVCYWDGSTTINSDWFHTYFSNYLKLYAPHPMLVFNKSLYIADGNLLHKWDGGSSYQYAQLTLDSDAVITALSIDPNTGRMMVAYCQVWSIAQYPTKSNVGLYDGTNPTQFVKIVPMDDQIYSLFSVGGTVYIGYGNTLGLWNGAGVTFLRSLTSQLGYIHKQAITNIGNDIYFYDNGYIWCYTELRGLDKKVFFKIQKMPYQQYLNVLFNFDDNTQIGFSNIDGSNNYHLWLLDVFATGSQTQLAIFYSNWYYFQRPIYVRGMDFLTDNLLTVNDTIVPSISDDNDNNYALIPSTLNNTVTKTNRLFLDSNPTTAVQLAVSMTSAIPWKRAIIYYDWAE